MGPTESFIRLVNEAKKNIKTISAESVFEKLKSKDPLVFIDVREEEDWKKGRAQGAIHISRGVLERDIEESVPKKDMTVILYCSGGFCSILATESVQKMGFTQIYSMEGGFKKWCELDLPRGNS